MQTKFQSIQAKFLQPQGSIGDIVKKLFRTCLDRRCFDAYTRRETVELEILEERPVPAAEGLSVKRRIGEKKRVKGAQGKAF